MATVMRSAVACAWHVAGISHPGLTKLNNTMQAHYILFLIDSKIKQHDGKVFKSYLAAKQYAKDCIEEKYCTKAIIGMFVFDAHLEEMLITHIDSIGFTGDSKNIDQLQLFKHGTN